MRGGARGGPKVKRARGQVPADHLVNLKRPPAPASPGSWSSAHFPDPTLEVRAGRSWVGSGIYKKALQGMLQIIQLRVGGDKSDRQALNVQVPLGQYSERRQDTKRKSKGTQLREARCVRWGREPREGPAEQETEGAEPTGPRNDAHRPSGHRAGKGPDLPRSGSAFQREGFEPGI